MTILPFCNLLTQPLTWEHGLKFGTRRANSSSQTFGLARKRSTLTSPPTVTSKSTTLPKMPILGLALAFTVTPNAQANLANVSWSFSSGSRGVTSQTIVLWLQTTKTTQLCTTVWRRTWPTCGSCREPQLWACSFKRKCLRSSTNNCPTLISTTRPLTFRAISVSMLTTTMRLLSSIRTEFSWINKGKSKGNDLSTHFDKI